MTSHRHGAKQMLQASPHQMMGTGYILFSAYMKSLKPWVFRKQCQNLNLRNEVVSPSQRIRLNLNPSGHVAAQERILPRLSALYSPTDWESFITIGVDVFTECFEDDQRDSQYSCKSFCKIQHLLISSSVIAIQCFVLRKFGEKILFVCELFGNDTVLVSDDVILVSKQFIFFSNLFLCITEFSFKCELYDIAVHNGKCFRIHIYQLL